MPGWIGQPRAVKIIRAQFVKPYVKSDNNDMVDAAWPLRRRYLMDFVATEKTSGKEAFKGEIS
jgi:hypothetical protein